MSDEEILKLENALLVFLLTPHIRKYLQNNDPVALYQAEDALSKATKERVIEYARDLKFK